MAPSTPAAGWAERPHSTPQTTLRWTPARWSNPKATQERTETAERVATRPQARSISIVSPTRGPKSARATGATPGVRPGTGTFVRLCCLGPQAGAKNHAVPGFEGATGTIFLYLMQRPLSPFHCVYDQGATSVLVHLEQGMSRDISSRDCTARTQQ